mmetsp:Transcript_85449/g.117882  ORF Transcript_85449/g.117882 Transcript_85449/m.117882 type:complete len:103 (+) Transcript_85449:739-1047(+)|eukprot:CAMPEP_0176341454 /NCGR_PEP_ID=MMETSP0126-20121128/2383_1 /TAXON_ID=141414 ORGANISM="Strombidinopsis acuminatum, Strain SPMC142" /NCGR_SAMPLE_ID=MMETSP0126 /ASSEMBLY_ACC=CAM_ASM_000229 /LENGTH=102 /DNA_ID=CAMNT_0017686265 /DNA_START=1463 /DNA_END=1771 /DNA_ORIENTATION=-
MIHKVMQYESSKIIAELGDYFNGYNPKIIFCMIDKMVDTRFFHEEDRAIKNPGSGTVIDKSLVKVNGGDQMFDFYMVPHKATIATARPVYYNVCLNTSKVSK